MSVIVSLPIDSRETVEFARGFHIPANRYDELLVFVECNHDVREAVAEIFLERAVVDPLTDEVSFAVPHWYAQMTAAAPEVVL